MSKLSNSHFQNNSKHTSPKPQVSRETIPRTNVLGVGVHAINMTDAMHIIDSAIDKGIKGYVCVINVHNIMEAQKDFHFKEVLNHSFLNTPDGMPIVWVGRIQGFSEICRVFGPDLMLEICKMSVPKGYTHFLYGGKPGIAEELSLRLNKINCGIKIIGTYTPPFRPLNNKEEKELIKLVALLKPDIFWVGIGVPKQEKFMAKYIHKLDTKLMLGVGAAFDFHTGRLRDTPTLMKKFGLQWLHRLSQEPLRLWKRYLINNPIFIFKILTQLLGLKKFEETKKL